MDVEMPWWGYGPHGMQLWFPSSLASPLSPHPQGGGDRSQHALDIELEFDQEVYPIGISLADASIVGITQRVTRAGEEANIGEGGGGDVGCAETEGASREGERERECV